MIDFDLALKAGIDAFARPIVVTPLGSMPGAPAYPARGVWASKAVDIIENGQILSSQEHTLGIRALEFPAPIRQGDQIEIDAYMSAPRLGIFLVEDGDDDGQGGTDLSLKVIGP